MSTPAQIKWRIAGEEFGNCNWGCPCQFNALPTTGRCEAFVTCLISEGYFSDTRLDGIVSPVSIGGRDRYTPDGFEYKEAEMANTVNCRVGAGDRLTFELNNTYAQLNAFDWSNQGGVPFKAQWLGAETQGLN